MRRVILIGAAAALCAAAAGCGGEGEKFIAHIGNAKVTQAQLDQTMEHFREEAKREGKAFSDGPEARKNLLGLLVYRTRIEQGAAALGITASQDEVEQRLSEAASEDADGGNDEEVFLESTVRAQLLTEAVYRTLANRIRDADPQQRQAKRNAALQRWLASLETRYPAS
jgi:hypothetical protein